MPFSNLTVVSVTGSEKYTQSSMWAVARSCMELPNAKGLIISPNKPHFPHSLPCEIKHQPCKPFGYLEYSLFMLYSLAQYIDTDYCLVVQNDGWVLNGKNWRDEFWNYDYIGAPIWANYQAKLNEFGQLKIELNREEPVIFDLMVQNGGFSFRSKRLLEMPRKLGIAVPLYAPDLAEKDIFEFKWSNHTHSEDIFLTVGLRPFLEQAGMKIAPFNVANQFSFESLGAPMLTETPINSYLGHHFFKKIEITDLNKVTMNFPAEWFPHNKLDDQILAEFSPLFKYFSDLGYEITLNPTK